jgi:glutamate synthase domain-containing protein 3
VDREAQESLRMLLEMHVERSRSGLGRAMLVDWPRSSEAMVRLTPRPQA